MKKILYFIIIFLILIIKVNVKASEVTLIKERIDDLYTAALEKYGTDSTITQAARKKYSKALANFEAKYGYTPQEFD